MTSLHLSSRIRVNIRTGKNQPPDKKVRPKNKQIRWEGNWKNFSSVTRPLWPFFGLESWTFAAVFLKTLEQNGIKKRGEKTIQLCSLKENLGLYGIYI